jgi:hypothetical protein
LVFDKNANFFAENWEKSQKLCDHFIDPWYHLGQKNQNMQKTVLSVLCSQEWLHPLEEGVLPLQASSGREA